MNPTGFVYDERLLEHDTGSGHPEQPSRLSHTFKILQQVPWFNKLKSITPQLAGMEWIRAIHGEDYIDRARQMCNAGERILDTPDVSISEGSYQAGLLAAGSGLVMIDLMMAGKIKNGFALVRPPGHHAEKNYAMGFCLFNNAAVAARYFQKKYGLERILILDWDVHHGNGTQHTFESDPTVFYVSLHQYPFYPGTGAALETGVGKGEGTTLNCPMKSGARDEDYREAFRSKIAPAVKGFKPDAVILSAGFDAHQSDPLANINLTASSFSWMTEEVLSWAAKYSEGRVISLLEGGYDLDALAECVETHLRTLNG